MTKPSNDLNVSTSSAGFDRGFDRGFTEGDEALVAGPLSSGRRVLVLVTPDEARAVAAAEAAAESLGLQAQRFSLAEGFGPGARGATPSKGAFPRPSDALVAAIKGGEDERLIIACEVLEGLDAVQRRHLRELALRGRGPTLVLVEPEHLLLPPEVLALELPAPNRARLEAELERFWDRFERSSGRQVGPLREARQRLARSALGLECFELEAALRDALARADADEVPAVSDVLDAVRAFKTGRVGPGEVLEAAEALPLRELGGLTSFKAWLQRRALALHPSARSAGIPFPRGVLLVGVQGCGKSMAARACADVLGLPLFRLDPGRLFEGVVGGSEARLARTLDRLERMAPVVLWLDEIDKGLAGSDGGASDGGTSARVVGGLLTWLQEREQPVFVVATANDPTALPAELQRRGRLDELFFVDLPDAASRARILEIHLLVRPLRTLGAAPPLAAPAEAFSELARSAEGFSGAELEAALVEARIDAFARGEALAPTDLERALDATVPLSRARRESVSRLRQWAQDRARRA